MDINRLNPDCISCLVKKYLESCPAEASKDERTRYMQGVLKLIAEAPKSMSAPEIVDKINKLQMRMFGTEHDYTDVKRYFNNLMLGIEPQLAEKINRAEDPLRTAVRYIMTGNYIDFGAMNKVDEGKLRELLGRAGDITVDENEFRALRDDLLRAKKLVYLTDNCGEIVLDKLLIRVIQKLNPSVEITGIVRGTPVLNDATMLDAEYVGLTELIRTISNGSTVAGTCLNKISPEALQAIDNADVIISKGQGNFETLSRCGKNVYYIFMCKCQMFADRFNVPLYSGMLIGDSTARKLL